MTGTKATIIKYMEQIQFGLHDFLSERVGITEEVSLKEIQINEKLTEINRTVQRLQREAGNSFLPRTTLKTRNSDNGKNIVVFRCVIMNPMTNMMILREILDEQEDIYRRTFT